MSIASDSISATDAAYDAVHADGYFEPEKRWQILSGPLAGVGFIIDPQTEQPLVLDTELAPDAREQTFIYLHHYEMNRLQALASALGHANPLELNTIVSGLGTQWKLVGNVDNNPANPRVKFQVVKIVAGKDSP